MGAGHSHQLYRPGDTLVHRLPPQCKLAAVAAFALVVVATPREWLWSFGLYAVLLGVVALAV
ncbi:cobalt ECF transporter T component CbiQ, partial [Streptosporangium algeriense]